MSLDDLGIYKKGPFGSSLTKSMFIPKGKNTIKVYEQKNAIKKDCNLGDYYISEDYFLSKMTSFEVFPHDVIVSCAGTIGETFIMPSNIERGIINQALMKMTITREIDIEYFLIYFDFILKDNAKKYSTGSAIKNIPPFEILKALFVALPPLNEQKRIVAKLNEILPFIDEYDKKEQELTALNQQFPEQLKKSILQAAIQGKLVEHDPNDEPASELIKRIQAEKERLISEKKIKKPKVKSEIVIRDNLPYEIVDGVERCIADEVPFEIPDSWAWVRLGDITYNLGQKTPKEEFNYIDVASIDNKKNIISDKLNLVTPEKSPSRARKILQNGSILYSTVRPYLKNICIFNACHNIESIASTAFAILDVYNGIFNKYLFYYLISPEFTDMVSKDMLGVAYPAINDEKLYRLYIAVPPLNEQKRIVQRIEKLFSYIEYLR